MDQCKPLAPGSADSCAPTYYGYGVYIEALYAIDQGSGNLSKALGQGLTLVHISSQRKYILWDTLGA